MLEDLEAALRSELSECGSEEEFWARVERSGTPRIVDTGAEQVDLTLLHRTKGSDVPYRVYVDAGPLTDHHAQRLETMTRLDDSGIWFWTTQVSRYWRGSYRFMPVTKSTADQLDPPGIGDTIEGVRSRFLGLLEYSTADPFDPRTAHVASLAEMPDAPVQRWWNDPDLPPTEPLHTTWHSPTLGNTRNIWIHETAGPGEDADRPLVIVLDGERWVQEYPLAPVLDRAASVGELPGAVFVFVDTIDNDARGRELPCNREFWRAVIDELLPSLAVRHPFTSDPRRTVASGQSYGGLASLFAALEFPGRVGLVSSHSGSFWWPTMKHGDDRGPAGGHIAELLAAQSDLLDFTIDMTVGVHEGDMPFHNSFVAQRLTGRGARVRYHEFDGGHEWVCWRGELVESLIRLLT